MIWGVGGEICQLHAFIETLSSACEYQYSITPLTNTLRVRWFGMTWVRFNDSVSRTSKAPRNPL